ncbi:hypothetical protein SAMN04515620_105123 [Collimonas sp. OK607]|uniref:hypothetical protein n=1 Tax=Collimonas sp. OK607 TaxID=1798194 RepID=UPI0008F3A9EA|nr:hypothetical protein [Collimonas sp. OK607]SFA85854.1 hypothetical protein SAMN04515620_105123 [Collimonas sp. OK607]
MNCVSTPDQIVTTLPRSQGLLGGVLQVIRNAAGWWQQRLAAPQAREVQSRYVLNAHELSDHLLRDIGYLDAAVPRGPAHQDTIY